MYKACIFDLDGTLTDSLDSLTYSVNETLKELGQPVITDEQCRNFVGNGARCLIEKALIATGDTHLAKIEEAMRVYGRVFGENCTYHVKPYEGIQEMLKALKDAGIRIAVVSNKPHRQSVNVVHAIFGEDVFDRIQGQCDEYPRKPDPTAVLEVLKEFEVNPAEGIYIGDSEVDMKTGKAAGMLTIGVNWGFRTKELLEESGADATIDHAEELLKFL